MINKTIDWCNNNRFASIDTLKRDLIEEAIIVSFVIVIFLFHFRSALIPIVSIPIALIASFIPLYFLQVSANISLWAGLRWRSAS